MFTLVLFLYAVRPFVWAQSSTTTSNSITTKPGTSERESKSQTTEALTTSSSLYSTTVYNRLTNELCASPNELSGTYNNIHLQGRLFPKEEGANVTMICVIEAKPAGCKDLINALANTTQLYTSDGNVIHFIERKYKVEEKTIEFRVTLDHKKHNRRNFFCRATNGSNLILESDHKIFGNISAKWDVFMEPTKITVITGSTFQLTCKTNDSEATPHIAWKRKKSEVGASSSKRLHTSNNTDGKVIISTADKISILTITQYSEWDGTYSCQASHTHSNPPYATAEVEVKSKDMMLLNVSIIVGCIVAAALILTIIAVALRKRTTKNKMKIARMLMDVQESHDIPLNTNFQTTDEPAVNCYSIDGVNLGIESLGNETLAETFNRLTTRWQKWQVDRSRLEIESILGEGNFGSVYLGYLSDQYAPGAGTQVAVKTIKANRLDKQAITEFEKEISVMTTLQHECIVSLIGLCTETMPLNIIMEFMKNGPLNKFLMERAPDKLQDTELTTRDLLYMSIQPCRALEYLTDKNIVHRDISARNCLVAEDYIVKLADFGLSRGTTEDGKNYYKKDGGMVPIKWMAPEALIYGKYTSSSDVWACAVLLWEIFSFGAIPYQGYSNQQVITLITAGEKLSKPAHCPEEVWKTISMCWAQDPNDRISVGGLSHLLAVELDAIDALVRKP